MKPVRPPTLSEYLLYAASKFLLYPHESRRRRTKTTVGDQELSDKMLGEVVEGRRTFTSHPGSKISNDPIYLDDIYCRERLRAVPEMVRVTLKLSELSLPESNSEWLIYLRESSNCLIFGLSQAAVALARAAVESRLRKAYAKLPGINAYATRDIKLDDLISNLSKFFNLSKGATGLSPEAESWARRVQKAGNNVLHDSHIEVEEALGVFEAARSMILSMGEKARP